jgi:PhoH-like ATPase
VIDELDRQKKDQADRGRTARQVSTTIRGILDNNPDSVENMKYKVGTTVSIVEFSGKTPWPESFERTNDNRIILVAKEVQENNPGRKVVFVTGDNGMVSRARLQGIKNVQKLENANKAQETDEVLERHLVVELSDEQLDLLRGENSLSLADAQSLFGLSADIQPRENQFLTFTHSHLKPSFVRYLQSPNGIKTEFDPHAFKEALGLVWRFHKLGNGQEVFSPVDKKAIDHLPIKPRNIEQIMVADLLLDSKINVVTLAGVAGSGKTLISLAAALSQSRLFGKQRYDRIVLMRPNHVVGAPVGFLKGNLREKHDDYMGAFRDNFSVIIEAMRAQKKKGLHRTENLPSSGKEEEGPEVITYEDLLNDRIPVRKVVDKLMAEDSPYVSIVPISHSRGRTWEKTLIFVDEAPNLTEHEAKTIGSRAGAGSTVLYGGDLEQIDNGAVNQINNGFTQTAQAFRIGRSDRSDAKYLSGHVNLTITERSEVARLFVELLRP